MKPAASKEHTASVLVVDDDISIIRYVEAVLESMGFSVVAALCGKDALHILEEHIPDIILLDIHLPEMSGIEVAKAVKNNVLLKDIPILAMTSDTSTETVNEAYAANFFDFIEKPINLSLFLNRIRKAIDFYRLNNTLQANEIILRQVQHIAGMGYWEYDSEIEQFVCSDELLNVLDMDVMSEFNLYSFLAQTHEDDLEKVSAELRRAIHEAKPYALEHRMHNGEGNEIIVLHQGRVVRKENSKYFKVISTITDITDRRQTQNLLVHNSLHDSLTGIPNRRHFCDHLGNMMLDNDRNEKLMAVIFIGIDRFKNINESLGHSIGDEFLIQMTERLSAIEDSFLARFSGDVFSMIVSNMNTIDGAVYATKTIQEKMAEPFNVMGHDLYVTVSIGVSVYPLCYGGKDQLISFAESAMHYSKECGGNRVSCFDNKITLKGKKRFFIETDLRKAIEKRQFEVYYQPQVAVANRRLIGMEALIRWNHPEHGLISPDAFIPIAEETGLIIPIGRWVLEEATRQVAEWEKKGYGLLRVGVNISALQFEDRYLKQNVENVLSRSGLMPCSLDLELTESAAMRDARHTISILNMFKEMGVQTSMDDFGTGYSSLSYLKMMPLHTLKIDRAFIKDINHAGENGELAKMIISMCHALGLNVIAEGVETEAHMQFLLQHECGEAQGYLFSPPVQATVFEELLVQYNRPGLTSRETGVSDEVFFN